MIDRFAATITIVTESCPAYAIGTDARNAIGMVDAVVLVHAWAAVATAVHVGLGAILDAVAAGTCFPLGATTIRYAQVIHADTRLAVGPMVAMPFVGTGHAVAATTIDVGFVAVLDAVVAVSRQLLWRRLWMLLRSVEITEPNGDDQNQIRQDQHGIGLHFPLLVS